MIEKVAFFAYRSKDTSADRAFWGDLLGLPLAQNFEDRWLEFETPDGKTIAVECMSPEGSGPILALETDDIAAEVARLKEGGVQFLRDIQDNKPQPWIPSARPEAGECVSRAPAQVSSTGAWLTPREDRRSRAGDREMGSLASRSAAPAVRTAEGMQGWGKVCKMAFALDPSGNKVMLHEIAPERA